MRLRLIKEIEAERIQLEKEIKEEQRRLEKELEEDRLRGFSLIPTSPISLLSKPSCGQTDRCTVGSTLMLNNLMCTTPFATYAQV